MNFNIYSKGIIYMSVCASKEMTREEVERRANEENPTGLDHGWSISEEKTFRSGEENPHECEQNPNNYHWLLVC